jgi:UvrB/uvrC motif
LSKDIATILEDWDVGPDDFQVRIIPGDDGREKLQVRIDLGLLQMEISGRPDGRRPFGFESLLDYQESRAHGAQRPRDDLVLNGEDCAELMREGVQYYHRYVSLFQLERYDLVARDTDRNLRLFAFVKRHAAREEDKREFDQFRPYVTMMRARALGMAALERDDHRAALRVIDEGIAAIRGFLAEYEESEEDVRCSELRFLKQWKRDVERSRRVGPAERLEEQLALAVKREQYEEAARLRDQIQRLGEASKPERKRPGLSAADT